MKQVIILAIALLQSVIAFASEPLVIDKLIYKPSDLSASSNLIKDINGNPCGLVKVISNDKSLSFEGSVIGTPEYKNGEFWVYMPKGTYQLKVKSDKNDPVMLNFKDYNLNGVDSKATYELTFHYQDYDRLYMKNYSIIQGPSLKKYAVCILTLPNGWTIGGMSTLDYMKRLAKIFATDGDSWGSKHTCTILAEKDGDEIYAYKLFVETMDSEDDAILSTAAGHGGFQEKVYLVEQ